MKKRMWISGFLAFFLCLSSLPVQAYTLEEDSESLLYSDLRPAAKSWGGGSAFSHESADVTLPLASALIHDAQGFLEEPIGVVSKANVRSDAGSLSYSYDEDTGVLTIAGDGVLDAEIKEQTDYSTWKNNVKTIEITGNITEIADQENSYGLFQLWKKLETVTYSGNTNFRVGAFAFAECPKLQTFPFSHVSAIGNSAFKSTAFTAVDLPHISGDIDDYAFSRNLSLTSLRISFDADSLYLGTSAFSYDSSNKGNLETVEISGTGTLRIGNDKTNEGSTFAWQPKLTTVDLSGFSGDIQLGYMVFAGDKTLEKIDLGEDAEISYVGYACFSDCVSLTADSLDFSKFSGIIARAAFSISIGDQTGALDDLTELDLSNVKEIGAFAMSAERKYEGYGYKNLTSVKLNSLKRLHAYAFQGASNIDWNNVNIPEDAKLAYSDVLVSSDVIWQRILEIMDGQFLLDSKGYAALLASSDNGWEDEKTGDKNSTAYDTTQLTKAAKWTDDERTKAAVELQFAYAPKQQMDFVFVLDTSTSMADWCDLNSQDSHLTLPVGEEADAQYAKMYEMQSKVADITEELLTCEQLDSRVAVVAFSNTYNFLSDGSVKLKDVINVSQKFDQEIGFYTADDLTEAIADIRNIPCKGSTYYYQGLFPACYYVQAAAAAGRDVTVVFVSDGEAMDTGNYLPYLTYYADFIKNSDPDKGYGKTIAGVLYKESPSEKDMRYIDLVSSEDKVYLASDTEEFSDALNRAIYTSLNSFTLSDQIGDSFEAVSSSDITVSGGNVSLSADGRTITWSFDDPIPYHTYTMTIQLALKQEEGSYPYGDFETNKGDAMLSEQESGELVNQVETPVLSREEKPIPTPDPDPDPDPDPKPNPVPTPVPDPAPNPQPTPNPNPAPNPSKPTPTPTPDVTVDADIDDDTPDQREPLPSQTAASTQSKQWAILCLLAAAGMAVILYFRAGIRKKAHK